MNFAEMEENIEISGSANGIVSARSELENKRSNLNNKHNSVVDDIVKYSKKNNQSQDEITSLLKTLNNKTLTKTDIDQILVKFIGKQEKAEKEKRSKVKPSTKSVDTNNLEWLKDLKNSLKSKATSKIKEEPFIKSMIELKTTIADKNDKIVSTLKKYNITPEKRKENEKDDKDFKEDSLKESKKTNKILRRSSLMSILKIAGIATGIASLYAVVKKIGDLLPDRFDDKEIEENVEKSTGTQKTTLDAFINASQGKSSQIKISDGSYKDLKTLTDDEIKDITSTNKGGFKSPKIALKNRESLMNSRDMLKSNDMSEKTYKARKTDRESGDRHFTRADAYQKSTHANDPKYDLNKDSSYMNRLPVDDETLSDIEKVVHFNHPKEAFNMNPMTLEKIRKLGSEYFRQYDKKLIIKSGARGLLKQADLYEGFKLGKAGYNKADKPGQSAHNFGVAVDYDKKNGLVTEQMLGKSGLSRVVDDEPWHLQDADYKSLAMLRNNFHGNEVAESYNEVLSRNTKNGKYTEDGFNKAKAILKPVPPLLKLADGGIADGRNATKAIIGEAGTPEAVIPLDAKGIEFMATAMGKAMGGKKDSNQVDMNAFTNSIVVGFQKALKSNKSNNFAVNAGNPYNSGTSTPEALR